MAERREILIDRLGAQGDGVAEDGGGAVFVPFTLAGERVAAEVEGDRGRLVEILDASPERAAPVCRHFGRCGGCSVQHLAPEPYRAWKRDLVVAAFAARGLDVEVDALAAPGGKRRRAVFSARLDAAGAVVGFHEAGSHSLIGIEECPVLEPKIVSALPALRSLVAPLLPKRSEARVAVTLTKSGLDVAVEGIEKRLSPDLRSRVSTQAAEAGFARVSVDGDIVSASLQPFLTFGTVDVVLPPGAFVQAVEEAEHEIARRVVIAVDKAKSVADLFCGLGAFTFPMARSGRVSAFDGDEAAIAALKTAAKKATGLRPIEARARDLFREPLSPLELDEHRAIVFDPPRAGAEAQAKKIARSKVKTVIAVSCNPATLARDARHLVGGGYKIESVTPIDQFVYSAHVEVVAVFRR